MATISFPLERADDGLALQVELINLTPTPTSSGWEVTRAPTGDAAVVVTFPPQHAVEYADTPAQLAPPQPRAILAPPSRVVFVVPAGTPPFPLSVAGILDAVSAFPIHGGPGSLTASVPAAAASGVGGDGGGATIQEARARRAEARALAEAEPVLAAGPSADLLPGVTPTSVFAPSRLELAIAGGGTRFVHAGEPATHDGATEQWHTRLAVLGASGRPVEHGTPVTVRSVVTSQFVPPTATAPADVAYRTVVDEDKIESTLTPTVANQVRANTNLFPLSLRHLTLSPAGASLDMERSWDEFEGTWPDGEADPVLKAYRHRVTWGRDSEIRTVQRGRVLPFRHQAILTTTTTRVPRDDADGSPAVLRTTSVITIYERTRTFSGNGRDGRAWPWQKVTALTTRSPGGEMTPNAQLGHLDVGTASSAVPFEAHYRATDRAGNDVEFSLPVVFAAENVSDATARTAWLNKPASFRRADLGGAPVVVAPPGAASAQAGGADTTTLVANEVTLQMSATSAPLVDKVVGSSPVVSGVAGPVETTFRWASRYLESGFDAAANPGELLLDLVPAPAAALAGRAEALAKVGLAPVKALSRRVGAIALAGEGAALAQQLADVALDRFDPLDWLGDLPSDLFGVFPLRDLLALRDGAQSLAAAPRQLAELVNGQKTFRSTWDVELLPSPKTYPPAAGALARLATRDGVPVHLHVEAVATVDPATQVGRASSTSTVTGAVLELIPVGEEHLVTLPIDRVTFEATDSAAPTVDVELGTVGFGGPLAYVKALADLIASSGLANPGLRRARPATVARVEGARAGGARAGAALAEGPPQGPFVDVLDDHVVAGLNIAIPDVAVGIFALRDLAFASRFQVFFDGRPPRLELDFATIDNPFQLTVSAIGGGGHLAVRLSATDLELVAGALEFGASVSINLAGIAKGSASVMGGVYFELGDDGLSLTGYLDIRGKLEVLSIVSLAVSVTLALAYEVGTGKVEGRAELCVKVKVLFFKKTVRFEVHRQFAGSNADPTFAELMAPSDRPAGEPLPWDAYCTAFAAA